MRVLRLTSLLRIVSIAAASLGIASASDLPSRMADALAASDAAAALPPGAMIEVVKMTPVRGDVLDIEVGSYDPRSGYFTAEVIHGPVRKGVSGRAPATIDAVVAARTIRPGEEVALHDLKTARLPIGQVPSSPIGSMSEAVGMAARTSIPAGRAVAAEALRAPLAVRRNEPVTLAYESEFLRLTAKGKALADGAPGEFVSVLNVTGGTVVEAQVVRPGVVRVAGGMR